MTNWFSTSTTNMWDIKCVNGTKNSETLTHRVLKTYLHRIQFLSAKIISNISIFTPKLQILIRKLWFRKIELFHLYCLLDFIFQALYFNELISEAIEFFLLWFLTCNEKWIGYKKLSVLCLLFDDLYISTVCQRLLVSSNCVRKLLGNAFQFGSSNKPLLFCV